MVIIFGHKFRLEQAVLILLTYRIFISSNHKFNIVGLFLRVCVEREAFLVIKFFFGYFF